MDADLQDPPEVVHALIARWKEGYDVVCAERGSRRGESRFKLMTAGLFYRLIGVLSEAPIRRDAGDFRLIDRKALDSFLAMPERDRFVRGMFAWIGSRQGNVTFDRPPRAAGKSKYSLKRMVARAANGLISFSDAPLRLALWAGAAVSALAFLYGLVVAGRWALGDPSLARGWSSTIVVIAGLGGANMLMSGVIGLYVGAEVKRRPLYVVERAVGFEDAPASVRRPVSRPANWRSAGPDSRPGPRMSRRADPNMD